MRHGRGSAPLLVLAAVLFGWGCAPGGLKKKKAQQAAQQAQQEDKDSGKDDDHEEASLRYKDYKPIKELVMVYFDYDKSELGEETRKALQQNAQWLKENPKAEIQIQGHCDERGTTGYNLALGQSRTKVARDYYKMLGIKLKRMSTISYGKEQLICTESTEECWQRNRRAETLIRKE